jgi:integrase
MTLRMARPMQRKGTSLRYFRERIPKDVLSKARGLLLTVPIGGEIISKRITENAVEVSFSLRSRGPAETKQRQAEAQAYLHSIWQGLRDGPRQLSHKQILALAGEAYRRFTAMADEPGPAEIWSTLVEINDAALADPSRSPFNIGPKAIPLEQWVGPTADELLAEHSMVVDQATRARLLVAITEAVSSAARHLGRNANADYRPDPEADKFPAFDAPSPTSIPLPSVTITGLFGAWWKKAEARGKSASTFASYGHTIRQFVALLGHDDALKVTPRDVIAFRDFRLAQISPRTGRGMSAKTVNHSDLAALKTVFNWAARDLIIPSNPAHGVKADDDDLPQNRDKDFTAEETTAILTHALKVTRVGKEHVKTVAAKRWVPWLLAYSGARVGEMLQLRKQDVRIKEGVWTLLITPDAGKVKNKRAREVPIHEHLIELGLIDFVDAAAAGPLFVTPGEGGDVLGPLNGVENRVREFVREVVSDPNVAPNHAWRHLFKSVGREAAIQDVVLDAICGHASVTVGRKYGRVTLKTKADALAKFPRFVTA